MEALIARYGLFVIFAGACLEGDLTLVLAGVSAHLGLVSLAPAVLTGTVGCLAGDLIWFGIGRWRSDVIQRSRVYRAVGPSVERLAARIGSWQLIVARLMYGTRMATMLFWGVYGLSPGRFIAVDLIGCFAWAALLGALGYGASSGVEVLIGRVRRAQIWLLGAAVVLLGGVVLANYLVRRRRQAQTVPPADG